MKASRAARFLLIAVMVVQGAWLRQASAGGGGSPADCETSGPSGAPVVITFVTKDVVPANNSTAVQVNNVTVMAEFRGVTAPTTFSVGGGIILPALTTMEAACAVFNDTGLSAQILQGVGLPGSTINFSRCSFLGPSATALDNNGCKAPAGTIHTPPGWVSGTVTGYASR